MPGLGSLLGLSPGDILEKTEKVYLIALDQKGSPDSRLPDLVLQHWPESFTDSRTSDRSQSDILGSSHPLYEWSKGTARTISFDAVFCRDQKPPEDVFGQLMGDLGSLVGTGDYRNPNIKAAIAWLRSFTYPEYDGETIMAPPPVMLVVPNSGIGVGSGREDEIVCYINDCNVTYEQFFPNGEPRIVTVNLSFTETIQSGTSIKPHDRNSLINMASGYNLRK